MATVADDSLERYEAAKALVSAIRERWVSEGSPLTCQGGATGRAEVVHPLVKLLQEAERDCDRFSRSLAPGRAAAGGRPKASSSAPDRKPPPAVLRAVS